MSCIRNAEEHVVTPGGHLTQRQLHLGSFAGQQGAEPNLGRFCIFLDTQRSILAASQTARRPQSAGRGT